VGYILVTMKPPVCLVCGATLTASGGDTNMYYCVKRKEYVAEWNVHLEVMDSIIYLDPISKQETMWVVEIPPYRFTMTDFSSGRKTEVHKKVLPDWPPWNKAADPESVKTLLYNELILTVPSLMKLPWHDRQKTLERLKLYLLFS
jgi:hypothetical protein